MTEEEIKQKVEIIRTECWEKAFHSYGVFYILKEKAAWLEFIMNVNKITGVIIPCLIGSIATTYSDNPELLKKIIFLTSPIAILQLLGSVYLMASNKENNYTTFVTGSIKNNQLNHDFEMMAKNPLPLAEYQSKFDILCERERVLKESDTFSDKDQRKGMKAALRNYRRACKGCGVEPNSMKSTNCDVCGNF